MPKIDPSPSLEKVPSPSVASVFSSILTSLVTILFATNEVNGILYANVDDDIGDEVGKIQNKNVILF